MQNFTDMDLSNKSAYMLVYEKKNKADFVLQGREQNLQDVIVLDQEKDIYSVKFEALPDYMPKELETQIMNQNEQFILMKNVYNQQFYDFLENVLD